MIDMGIIISDGIIKIITSYFPIKIKLMSEQNLKDYFENKLTGELLHQDLKNSQRKTSYDVTAIQIDSLSKGDFEVTKEHLIKLIDDTISEKLRPIDLNTIGFALITSDYFYWNNKTEVGERIDNVLFDFDNTIIGHDLTIKNLQLWKKYLLTGEYRLDENELKQKLRSNGKYIELYRSIDEILWRNWDPIGVNDIATRDEYQCYTPIIFNLKRSGADKETIAKTLYEIETITIGLIGNFEQCSQVAEKIINLK